jgi:hypothetical protein
MIALSLAHCSTHFPGDLSQPQAGGQA